MELHVYAPIGGSPTLDPECLATVWLAELSGKQVKTYASNNTDLSPTGRLPVLLTGGTAITGYPEIASYLLDKELEPVETAVLAYCQQLAVITSWNLFVVPENYEGLTRPEISASIPFPMQYNAALSLQKQAAACQPAKAGSATGGIPATEAINKLHAAMLEKNKEAEKSRETPRETLRRMVQLKDIFETVAPLIRDLAPESPARLFVAANLVLLTLPRLPHPVLAYLVDENDEIREIRDYGRSLNFQTPQICHDIPSTKQYTLWNTVCHHASSILAWGSQPAVHNVVNHS